jgi:hypothetical protein
MSGTEVRQPKPVPDASRDSESAEASPSRIVSAETAGLGNRIKSWVSAMRWSADARVHWPVTPNMPARFDELFANGCAVDSIPDGARIYSSWRLAVLPEDEAHIPAGFATVGAGAHPLVRAAGKAWWTLRGRPDDRYLYMLFPKTHSRRSTRADARHLDFEYGRIPAALRGVYVPLFERVRMRSELAQMALGWALDVGIGDAEVGVQIRTWRDDPRRHAKYHRSSFKRLLRLLEREPASTRFVCVSDDDDVLERLAGRFGTARVLRYPRRTPRAKSWSTPEGVAEDLIDMLLLTRTRRLFASYLSTFSETAWWLGGARAEVTVF